MQTFTDRISLVTKPLLFTENKSHQSVFARLAQKPWSIWLDSCDSDHVDSQFDIMVWQPAVTVTAGEQDTEIKVFDSRFSSLARQSTDDPLSLLKQVQNTIFADANVEPSQLPFNGGAVGYFSYDLGRRFEQLPSLSEDDIKQPSMSVGLYLQAIIYDRRSQQTYLVAEADRWQELADNLVNSESVFVDNQFSLTSDWQSNMSEQAYHEKFARVYDYLIAGDCYQINLAQRFSASYQGDEFDAYLTLREANQAPFSAFMRFDDSAVVSISPERFLRVSDRQVQTKPIKGTLPRSTDEITDKANAEQLKASQKDRAENLMIVDLLRNDLSRVCQAGTVEVPKLFDIESFPAVHHLVSTVTGTLAEDKDNTDLLRAAFPGGSITGAPKIRAMEIIEELEPHRRNLYCGSIGYLSACGNMDTSITIRTLICKDNNIHCWAGGGLVADSKADSEYQETFDKVRKILPVLAR